MTRSMGRKATEQVSLVLSPEQLAEFAKVDAQLPILVIEARNAELRRSFVYAMSSLFSGVAVVVVILGLFAYLVMHGHVEAATALLGIGICTLAGGFLRSRL